MPVWGRSGFTRISVRPARSKSVAGLFFLLIAQLLMSRKRRPPRWSATSRPDSDLTIGIHQDLRQAGTFEVGGRTILFVDRPVADEPEAKTTPMVGHEPPRLRSDDRDSPGSPSGRHVRSRWPDYSFC